MIKAQNMNWEVYINNDTTSRLYNFENISNILSEDITKQEIGLFTTTEIRIPKFKKISCRIKVSEFIHSQEYIQEPTEDDKYFRKIINVYKNATLQIDFIRSEKSIYGRYRVDCTIFNDDGLVIYEAINSRCDFSQEESIIPLNKYDRQLLDDILIFEIYPILRRNIQYYYIIGLYDIVSGY